VRRTPTFRVSGAQRQAGRLTPLFALPRLQA
jgi:hypothetical protein